MNKIAIKTLVMAAAISSPLAAQLIRTGPYASNLTPASDHSLGLKQVLIIRTQFPDLATSKTQVDCQTLLQEGFHGMLGKPYHINELIELIEKLVKGR